VSKSILHYLQIAARIDNIVGSSPKTFADAVRDGGQVVVDLHHHRRADGRDVVHWRPPRMMRSWGLPVQGADDGGDFADPPQAKRDLRTSAPTPGFDR
jgi:hypothetical protein